MKTIFRKSYFILAALLLGACFVQCSDDEDTTTKRNVEIFFANGVNFSMVKVEKGDFVMGCTDPRFMGSCENAQPAHRVTINRNYYIGCTEVTQQLWNAIMGFNPSTIKGDNLPVTDVTWNDCKTFINKLNEVTGKKFSFPTEAQWEFAARGGNKSRKYIYSGSNDLNEVAWDILSILALPHAVATKMPNELGIYDMSGNVYEYCQDWFAPYEAMDATDPTGPINGDEKVVRGYGSTEDTHNCCVFSRSSIAPDGNATMAYGLRIVLIE